MDTNQYLIAFGIYFLALVLIEIITCHKRMSATQFMTGNRSLNFWVTAFSAHSADMSSWLFMAFPMAIFTQGLPMAWIASGLIIGMGMNWHYIAPKLRLATEYYNNLTLPGFFGSRFHDNNGHLRLLCSVVMIVFLSYYLVAGLTAIGLILETLFQLDYKKGICIAALIMVIYTSLGGFIAVAWMDFFQGLFLLSALILVPLIAYNNLLVEGWLSITQEAQFNELPLHLFPHSLEEGLSILAVAMAWGLGYFGMPQILCKFMGIDNPKEIYKSKILGISWLTLILSGAIISALIGVGAFSGQLENPELVFINLCTHSLFPLATGFVLCAIVAATLSNMDSQALVISSIITDDLYNGFLKKERKEREMSIISHLSIFIVSIFALYHAYEHKHTIYDTIFYAWTGLGCSFGPLVIMSLYYEKTSRNGAFAGVTTGALFTFLYPALAPVWLQAALPAMIPGFFLSLFMIWLVSQIYSDTHSST